VGNSRSVVGRRQAHGNAVMVRFIGESPTHKQGFADEFSSDDSSHFPMQFTGRKTVNELFTGTPKKSSTMEVRIRRADCEVAGHN
jgi:hypothetical protein